MLQRHRCGRHRTSHAPLSLMLLLLVSVDGGGRSLTQGGAVMGGVSAVGACLHDSLGAFRGLALGEDLAAAAGGGGASVVHEGGGRQAVGRDGRVGAVREAAT